MGRRHTVAWVESPLQLIAAAEYAHATGRMLDVAMRVTGPQMPQTARALLDRGASFAACVPYFGIPWSMLARREHWLVGDGFSGQFQLAMSTLGTRAVTLVDDGIMTIRLARALSGFTAYERGDRPTSPRRALLASLTRERLLALAARDTLEFFTAFADHESLDALRKSGIPATENDFNWLRSTGRPISLPGSTIILGAAIVADGTLGDRSYLDWVASVARDFAGPAAYLPHRREPAWLVDAVADLPGITVIRTGIPVELALAGLDCPVDIVTLPSTAAVTLRAVLAGTGSVVRTHRVPEVVS